MKWDGTARNPFLFSFFCFSWVVFLRSALRLFFFDDITTSLLARFLVVKLLFVLSLSANGMGGDDDRRGTD